MSVGVASVLLGVTFAAGTASADSTTANADSASGSDSAEQTDHNLTLNSASTSTLKSATAENQSSNASAAVQNPAGDIKAQAANDYEAAVNAAVANASSDVASEATQNSASAAQNSAASNTSAVSSTANNDEYSNYETVTDWNGLQNAVLSGAKGVNIKGNITPGLFGTLLGNGLTINGTFTIHGIDGAVLNLGQNKINNNGQLTLADVTVNGAIAGNGTVNIKGTVNSNIDATSGQITGNTSEVASLLDDVLGTKNGGGYGLTWTGNADRWVATNWYKANIKASKVNIDQGATLNINRTVTGDGIETPSNGVVNAGINSHLNINLKDAQTASRANEQSSSMDNASAGIRIYDNGTIVRLPLAIAQK